MAQTTLCHFGFTLEPGIKALVNSQWQSNGTALTEGGHSVFGFDWHPYTHDFARRYIERSRSGIQPRMKRTKRLFRMELNRPTDYLNGDDRIHFP